MTTTDITEPETEQLERYAGAATTEGAVKKMLATLTTGNNIRHSGRET